MLKHITADAIPEMAGTSIVLIIGIFSGALIGSFTPVTGEWLGNQVDYTLVALVSLLFLNVRFGALVQAIKNYRFLSIALVANFILVPLIGYGIASIFLPAYPLFMVGLIIYFMSPCTDWFLSFTRLSGGNIALGTTLIPINMTLQLLLYPIFIQWFTHNTVQIKADTIVSTLQQWFLLPFLLSVITHQVLCIFLQPDNFKRFLQFTDNATPWVTTLLVFQIFAGNITTILEYHGVFTLMLLAIITFFILTFFLGEAFSRTFKLNYPEHALLTMTIAARNAPLMLAITMVVLPNQPLIYAALIIGMLVEFPHLTLLRRLLLRNLRSGKKYSFHSPVSALDSEH